MATEKIAITDKLRNDIIERRKQEALSSYELSEKSGHSKFWLQNIESGKTKKISKSDLLSIYKILLYTDDSEDVIDDVEQILNQQIGSDQKEWYELIQISSDFEEMFDEDEIMETLEEYWNEKLYDQIRNSVFNMTTNQKQAALTAIQNFYYSLYKNPELTLALINIPIYGVDKSNPEEHNNAVKDLLAIAAKYNDLAIKNNTMDTIEAWQEYDKYYAEIDKKTIHIALNNFKNSIQKLLKATQITNPDIRSILDDFIQNVTFTIEHGQPNALKKHLNSFLHIYNGKKFSSHIQDCVKWFIGFQHEYDLPFIYDVVSKEDLNKIYNYLDSYGEIKRTPLT